MNSYYTVCIKLYEFIQKPQTIVQIRLYEFVQKPHRVQILTLQLGKLLKYLVLAFFATPGQLI